MENSLKNVVKIFETGSTEKANKYLSIGWELIETFTNCYDPSYPMSKHQYINYVLVWMSTNGEVKFPESEEYGCGTVI